MFKKFVTLLATVALVTSLVASVITPSASAAALTVSLSATPSTFNPTSGSTSIKLNLSENVSSMYVWILYPDNRMAILANHVPVNAPGETYTWTGREGNSATGAALPKGTYTVKATAREGTALLGYALADIEISDSTTTGTITNLEASPTEFRANGSDSTNVSFTTTKRAALTVKITRSGASNPVKTFTKFDGDTFSAGDYNVTWDGTNDDGDYVSAGDYSATVTADSNSQSTTVTVLGATSSSDNIVRGSLDPNTTWDPSNDEALVIKYELRNEVNELSIVAIDPNTGVEYEVFDDTNVEKGKYEEEWDGTDENGDYVDGDSNKKWQIVVRADEDELSMGVKVVYDNPEITDAFVTKSEFDPSKDENISLVYKVNAKALVTVEAYKGSHREITLVDEKSVSKNKYYAVRWDGKDEDGDTVDEGGDWKFRITATNSSNDSEDPNTVDKSFSVKEDSVSSGKANVTNDEVSPVVFDTNNDSEVEINYCIDEDAEVYLGVYEGSSAGSKADAELLNYVSKDAGCYTETWNGKDDDGKKMDDGMFTYKVISKTSGSKKDTETGKFILGDAGSYLDDNSDDNNNNNDNGTYSCAMYGDLRNISGTELCEAIGWATNQGIFQGYVDGTFRSYQNITRAEVLKVVLEAYQTMLLPSNGSTLGFKDLDANAWYMTYARTAQFYGMLDGYGDGTARLGNNVNRVEMLKFVLQAAEAFTGKDITGNTQAAYADVDLRAWYSKYVSAAYTYGLYNVTEYKGQKYLSPEKLVQRGEVALMLYRLSKAGLL